MHEGCLAPGPTGSLRAGKALTFVADRAFGAIGLRRELGAATRHPASVVDHIDCALQGGRRVP